MPAPIKVIGIGIILVRMATFPALASDGWWKRSYQPDQEDITKIDKAAERFNGFDAIASSKEKSIPEYIRSGIVLSDLACQNWLDSLGRADRDASFSKDVLNVVGNLILGISGINGANPSSLARGSLGLAAGNASVDAFKNEVILGSISDIEAKLTEGRKITAATIKSYIPTTTNYDDAKGLLIAYHRDCSPNAIKTLLKTSLAAVKYEPADTTLGGAVAKAKAAGLVATLSKDMYPDAGKTLTDDDLYALYLVKIMKPADARFIDSMLPRNSQKLLDDFSSKNEPARLDELQDIAVLKRFDVQYKEDKVVAQRKVALDQQTARAETSSANQNMDKAINAIPPKQVAKVANTPQLRELWTQPGALASNPALTEQVRKNSDGLANARGGQAIKNLAEASKKVLEAHEKEQKANDAAAAVAAAPDPPKALPESRSLLLAPISVNAVLVPAMTGK